MRNNPNADLTMPYPTSLCRRAANYVEIISSWRPRKIWLEISCLLTNNFVAKNDIFLLPSTRFKPSPWTRARSCILLQTGNGKSTGERLTMCLGSLHLHRTAAFRVTASSIATNTPQKLSKYFLLEPTFKHQ